MNHNLSLSGLSVVALRLLAIYYMITLVTQLPIVLFYGESANTTIISLALLPIFIISVALWLLAPHISKKIIAGYGETSGMLADIAAFESMSISLLGIIFLVLSLPNVLTILIVKSAGLERSLAFSLSPLAKSNSNLISESIKLILSIVLVIKAKGISLLINKCRNWGR